jgi:hypothetical protein
MLASIQPAPMNQIKTDLGIDHDSEKGGNALVHGTLGSFLDSLSGLLSGKFANTRCLASLYN